MLLPPTPIFRKRRGPNKPRLISPPPPVPPLALTLVGAGYNESGGPGGEATLTLTFDRPVDIAAFSGAAIAVADGLINNGLYQGGSATLIGPSTIEIMLDAVGSYFEADQHMSATP